MYVVDVGVKCPKCGVRFNSRQLPVLEDTGMRNSELRLTPADGSERFEHFAVCTCPSCGKSDWANTFEVTYEQVSFSQQNLTAHLQYRTAAIEAERQGRDWFNVGLLYLYAAWCADDAMAFPQAREYRRHAVESFRKSLLDNSCPFQERMTIEYLIGEVLRRAAAYDDCKQHFKEVIARLSSQYAFMARKLMRLAESQSSEPIPFDVSGT